MVMRLLDLFSGIGGFSYAAEKLVGGYETVAFCEQDEFCQQVLRKHWKDVPIYDDVRTIDATRLGRIDIVAGGFPCQAVSQAGLQKATEDDRWLWDEMFRIIQDCKPKWVIGENVQGLININEGVLFEQVQTDLENEGYSVQSVVIPACAKNAPHRRDRVWIIGNSEHNGSLATKIRGSNEEVAGRTQKGQETTRQFEGASRSENHDDVPNTKSNGNRRVSRDLDKKGEKKERQGFGYVFQESVNDGEDDVSNTDSIRCRGGSCKGCSKCKRQVFSAKRKRREMGSEVEGCSKSYGEKKDATNSNDKRLQGFRQHKQLEREQREDEFAKSSTPTTEHRATQCRMGYMADGLSEALSGHFSEEPKDIPRVTQNQKDRTKKLKALGNSIVPQVAAELFYAIKIAEYGE